MDREGVQQRGGGDEVGEGGGGVVAEGAARADHVEGGSDQAQDDPSESGPASWHGGKLMLWTVVRWYRPLRRAFRATSPRSGEDDWTLCSAPSGALRATSPRSGEDDWTLCSGPSGALRATSPRSGEDDWTLCSGPSGALRATSPRSGEDG